MPITTIPTRTSADPNSATDINTLMANDLALYASLGSGSGLPAGVQGNILYKGASAWATLAPGTTGQILETQGAGANPRWVTPASGSTTPIQHFIDGVVYVQDNIIFRRLSRAITLTGVRMGLYPAPTGTGSTKGKIMYHATDPASATTIFTSETNAPAITAGNLTADSGTPDVTSLAENGWVGYGFSAVCGTTPGGGNPGGASFRLLE